MKIFLSSGAVLEVRTPGNEVSVNYDSGSGLITISTKATEKKSSFLVAQITGSTVIIYDADKIISYTPPRSPVFNNANTVLPDLSTVIESLGHDTIRQLKNKLTKYQVKERKWRK
jgi:hypothetical protein